MSKNAIITRKNQEIPLQEWKAIVADDREMELTGRAEVKTGKNRTAVYENEGLAVWTAHPGPLALGNQAWFDYQHGFVVVKNPDAPMILKLRSLARKLGARVLNDNGQRYRLPNRRSIAITATSPD